MRVAAQAAASAMPTPDHLNKNFSGAAQTVAAPAPEMEKGIVPLVLKRRGA